MSLLEKIIAGIKPLNREVMEQAKKHQAQLTKPPGSLGILEELAIKIAGIRSELFPELKKKRVVVFAGDHGVVEEGVSAYPQEVTAQMVYNFLRGGAGINAIASKVGAEVEVVDIGVEQDFPELEGLVSKKLRKGTRNFIKEPAMTRQEVIKAIEVGIERAQVAFEEGVDMIAGGDMGIGNTTSSSAIFSSLLNFYPEEVVGAGTGLEPEKIAHKIQIIKTAFKQYQQEIDFNNPLEVLRVFGGYEIAGLVGLYLGSAEKRLICLVDGFIATAGALITIRLCPLLKDFLIFAHCSEEKGHRIVLEKIGVKPLLNLELRLGEGTGACLGMEIVESALFCHNQMATFESAGVSEKI